MFLNCHSWASLKYGVMPPQALLEEAARAGVRTLALTDIHSSAGVPDLVRDAPQHGVRPVAGITFRQGARTLYIGLARDNDGLQRLNELLSAHLLEGTPLPASPPDMEGVFFVLPFATTAPRPLRPHERIGVRPADLTRLPFSPWVRLPQQLVAWLPVTFPAPGAAPGRGFNTHRLLRTMARNTVLSLLPAEELARPDEVFLPEAEVLRIYRHHPHLPLNAAQLLEQCTIAFDGSDKTWRCFGPDARADRERLHADALRGLHQRYGRPSQRALERLRYELEVIERMGFISYFRINQDIVDFARGRGFFHVGRGSGANSLVAYCLRITDVDPLELDLYFERFINPARKNPPDFDIDFSWKDRDEVFRYIFGKYNHGAGGGRGIHAAQIATYTTFQWRGAVRELGKALGLPPAEIDALSEGDRGPYHRGRPGAQARSGGLDHVADAVVRHARLLLGMPHQLGIHAGGIVITERPVTRYTALHRPPKGFPVTQISMLECEDMGLHKFDILSQRGLGHIRDAVELVNGQRGDDTAIMVDGTRSVDPPGPPPPIGHRASGNGQLRTANYEPRTTGASSASASGAQQRATRIRHQTSDNQQLTTDNEQRTTTIDIHDIPRFKADPAIKELLRKGDTIGCFYVESPAMRMLLKKLRVDDYLGLVAASSIIRPGVAESGMMREYLLRHHDPERRKRAPRRLLEIMPETYGVMVYQEDVLKVAVQYGGLDLTEADQVRRGMNLRYRDRPEFKAVERKFFANCKAFGHPPEETQEIWRQIESFASFSFAKGHSASYAVESYQSLYLKAHHPLEFLVAVINNFGGFYSTEFYLHEAKRAGAVIEAPCVNASGELCVLVRGSGPLTVVRCQARTRDPHRTSDIGQTTDDRQRAPDNQGPTITNYAPRTTPRIFLGLAHIKSLAAETVQLLLHERRRHGPFADLHDLLRRVPIELEQARILVRAGALRFTGRSKPQLLWDLALLHRPAMAVANGDLFTTRVEEPALPPLHHHPLADAYDEMELLGFPLCDPFELVGHGEENRQDAEVLTRRREGAKGNASVAGDGRMAIGSRTTDNRQPATILKHDMPNHIGRRVSMLGYLVHLKPASTRMGAWMSFGSFIDPAGDFWGSTQFPQVAARHPFRGRGVYLLTGTVEAEFGHCALRTERIEKLPWKPDPRYGAE